MILALETSTRRASLAIYDPSTSSVIESAAFVTERAHNTAIFSPLEKLMELHGASLTGVLVGLGPGSYGGVRVGIAVANGLAVATGLPVAGGSSLEAWDVEEASYLVVSDARRGSYSVALVRDRMLCGEFVLMAEDAVPRYLAPFLAEGLPVYSSEEKVIESFPESSLAGPSAERLAENFLRHGEAIWQRDPLEPIYLRAPYITQPKARQ